MNIDTLKIIEDGIEQMSNVVETHASGNNATDESQHQKWLDYSGLDTPPVIWHP